MEGASPFVYFSFFSFFIPTNDRSPVFIARTQGFQGRSVPGASVCQLLDWTGKIWKRTGPLAHVYLCNSPCLELFNPKPFPSCLLFLHPGSDSREGWKL